MSADPRLLLDFLKVTEKFFAGKGIDSPRLDAELLLAHVLGVDRIALYTQYDRPLAADEIDRFRETVRRRAAREPVAYVVGSREFYSLDFAVDRRVLVPRPETELLVDTALERLDADADVRVADIGTGSGAIAVAVAHERPLARVVASDVAEAALEVAPGNAERHGVEDRVRFVCGDLFEPFDGEPVFDAVLSNPPYIRSSELKALAPEVRDWEPKHALASGGSGLAVTERLIAGAPAHLAADGWLIFEVGTQADEARGLLDAAGWRDVESRKDLAGQERVLAARRPLD